MPTPALNLAISPDSFAWSLETISRDQRVPVSSAILAREFPPPHDLASLQLAARAMGVRARIGVRAMRDLKSTPASYFALVRDVPSHNTMTVPADTPALRDVSAVGSQRLVRIVRIDGNTVVLRESGQASETVLTPSQFEAIYTGHALELLGPPQVVGAPAEVPVPRPAFGLRWFGREMMRYPAIWRDVLLAAAAVQLLALLVPLLTQVIIDKVIVHRTVNTLNVSRGQLHIIVA